MTFWQVLWLIIVWDFLKVFVKFIVPVLRDNTKRLKQLKDMEHG